MMPSPINCNTANVVQFIHAHKGDANTLGQTLLIPAEYILGLSGWETQWGANRFALEGNNYFSLHGGADAPYATGMMKALKADIHMSTFPSYLASGQSFIAQYGKFLRGAQTRSLLPKLSFEVVSTAETRPTAEIPNS